MSLQAHSNDLNHELEQLIQGVLSTGRITYSDKQRFLDFLIAGETLTSRQLAQVRSVSDRLQMGLLKVVD